MTQSAIVVAGLSARMLAESARRAGWRVIALDLFGDSDTRAAAQRWHPVGQAETLSLDPVRTRAALERASFERGVIGWIAGSGFEACPALLQADIAGLPLIGNGPSAHDVVRDPNRFFDLLTGHGIDHPETRTEPPLDARGWLRKDVSGTGGWHIRPADAVQNAPHDARNGVYYQRFSPGRPMSALFLANGRNATVLGINEQIVVRHGEHPFTWRGAIGPVQTGARLADAVRHAVQAVVAASGLVGLNSLDFLSDGESCIVLEVNARPSATMALYDCDPLAPLLARHVRACLGESLDTFEDGNATALAPPVRGQLVVFAQADHLVAPAFEDQARRLGWCHDIPVAGSAMAAGTPLCSVSAVCAPGASVDAVRAALAARAAAIEPLMKVSHERSFAHR